MLILIYFDWEVIKFNMNVYLFFIIYNFNLPLVYYNNINILILN